MQEGTTIIFIFNNDLIWNLKKNIFVSYVTFNDEDLNFISAVPEEAVNWNNETLDNYINIESQKIAKNSDVEHNPPMRVPHDHVHPPLQPYLFSSIETRFAKRLTKNSTVNGFFASAMF